VSDHWQQVLQQDYGIAAPKVLNGVNLERFSPVLSGQELGLKQRYGIQGSPIFLTVGGIEPRKNSIRLLEAFAQVLFCLPQAQLVIAGGATLFDYQDYREEFFRCVDALGIKVGESLILPGVLSDEELPILYRCADAFCFPSLKEGWGLVLLEAIASGLPLMVPQESPFTEFLSQVSVEWVSAQSTVSIAAGMLNVSKTIRASELTSQNQKLLQHYSWKNSAQHHVRVYERLRQTLD
jgi:glycosyltransferase-like protein